jgi:hypothetical protein
MTVCGSSCPTGYKANNTDCNDNNPNVFPGQTALFGVGIDGTFTNKADSNWDYDCDGIRTMDPLYTCGTCNAGCGTNGCSGAGVTCGSQVIPSGGCCVQSGVIGSDGIGRTGCR